MFRLWEQLKRFFQPPVFQDEQRTYTARLLHIVLWTTIGVINLMGVGNLLTLPGIAGRWLFMMALMNFVCLILLALMRKGYTRAASIILVAFLWIDLTGFAVTAGGIRSMAVISYLIMVMTSGILLGEKIGFLTAAISILSMLGIVTADQYGLLPPSTVQHTPYSLWVTISSLILIISGLQYLASHDLRLALNASHQALNERRSAQAALKKSENRFQILIEAAPMAIIIARKGLITYTNPASLRLFGFENSAEIYGHSLLERASVPYRDAILNLIQLRRSGDKLPQTFEISGLRRDGSEFPIRLLMAPVEFVEGPATICFIIDISEEKKLEEFRRQHDAELEQQVSERTVELSSANQELADFAHSVSHDLRGPLRGIIGWSQLLEQEYGGRLDEQGHEYLTTICSETRRMSDLIEALLTMASMVRGEMKRETVDLSRIAQTIEKALQKSEPERQVRFIIQPKLVVNADPVLIHVVMENLINNAWKFTRKKRLARIEIGMDSQSPNPAYFIRDNGVGFDMAFVGNLFKPFQRLHLLDDFPGTGIGLATVDRIIRRHGGRIWVEAKEGKGATFFFEI